MTKRKVVLVVLRGIHTKDSKRYNELAFQVRSVVVLRHVQTHPWNFLSSISHPWNLLSSIFHGKKMY
jgi:hypothetical protein